MHKQPPKKKITSLHDLSATDLIAGYRAKQFSPSEVLEEVIEHAAAWGRTSRRSICSIPTARAPPRRRPTAGRRPGRHARRRAVAIKDNIATKGQPIPLGAASVKLVPAEKDAPPAARLRKPARSSFPRPRCRITACCRRGFPVSIPSPATLGPRQESRRVLLRGWRGGRGRLRTAASRDRHRRFGTAAGPGAGWSR